MYLNGYNTNYNKNGPAVYLRPQVMRKLMAYYRLIDDVHKGAEISGLGLVQDWDGDLLVHDFILFKQEVTGGDTELDPAELSEWLTDMLSKGQDPEMIRLWWHKHPITGWSSIDDANIERMNNENWLLSLVHTPQGVLARLDLYKPFRCTLDNLQIIEITETDKVLDSTVLAEIKEKVSRKSYVGTTTQFGQGYQTSYARPAYDWKEESKKNETGRGTGNADDYFARLADREWETFYTFETYERNLTPTEETHKRGPGRMGPEVI